MLEARGAAAAGRAASSLASMTWLASIIVLCLPIADARRSRPQTGGGSGRNDRGGRHPAMNHAAANANRRNGQSPNYDTLYADEFHLSSSSFYERHGLAAPPLISRAERHRRAQEETGGVFDGENTGETELDMIVEEAKDGSDAATRLREDLIRTGAYDRHAYPWDYPWYGQGAGERTGVPVELGVNFHRVYSVDVINPVLDLVVWLRMAWTDPRLTWKPEEYGNLTKAWFWIGDGGAGGETSEIWTPDIELWNLEEGLRDSFDDAYATVNNDGTIWWSRPGHLRPVCKYYGLDNFPFDKLTCTMEFGSWAYSGKYLRPTKMGDGYSLGGSETAGESFNEFSFVEDNPVTCVLNVYPPYPGAPEEDWPVLLYNVTIERAWQPYARGYITMQVMLNIIGFTAFWLPPMCGERMSLSITAMLAAVAAEIVIAANLPSAAEYTWFQKFSLLSMTFAFISLIESVMVLYFYYKRTEDMIPQWYTEFRKWAYKRGQTAIAESARRSTVLLHEANDQIHKKIDGVRRNSDHGGKSNDPKYDEDDSFSENMKRDTGGKATKVPVPDEGESFHDALDTSESEQQVSRRNDTAGGTGGDAGGDEGSIELNGSDFGVIETDKSLQGSYISELGFDGKAVSAKKLSSNPTKESVREVEQEKNVSFARRMSSKSDKGTSGRRLSIESDPDRMAMRALRESTAASESMRSVLVPRDADDFNNQEEMELNKKWKKFAARIDDISRFWIPLAFFISLAAILAQVM